MRVVRVHFLQDEREKEEETESKQISCLLFSSYHFTFFPLSAHLALLWGLC